MTVVVMPTSTLLNHTKAGTEPTLAAAAAAAPLPATAAAPVAAAMAGAAVGSCAR